MKKYAEHLDDIVVLFLIFLMITIGCVGRKRPDDIELIKNLLGQLSYALNQKDFVLLDSLYYGEKAEKDSLLSKLTDDVNSLGEIRNLGFGGKRIEIYGNEAFVNFTLVVEKVDDGKIQRIELPMEFSLVKKGDRWKVVGHRFLKLQ